MYYFSEGDHVIHTIFIHTYYVKTTFSQVYFLEILFHIFLFFKKYIFKFSVTENCLVMFDIPLEQSFTFGQLAICSYNVTLCVQTRTHILCISIFPACSIIPSTVCVH